MYDWANKVNGVLIKSDRDRYVLLFEQRYLNDVKEDKFSILDKIKDINTKEKVQFTLSIALSNEGKTDKEKYKSAQAAMDVVLGRGGDQAAIRENEIYKFFGGRVEEVEKRNEDPFVLILDGIEDPHNLGSIIRTAETAGVHGIIIPKRRAASVNSTVSKVSAGAVQYMKIARVNNLNETIKYLKDNDVWIYGTDMDTETIYYDEDMTGNVAIVIGSEGFGMSRLVKENCDFLIKIPMKGKITSLNASVSAGIVMYEVVKQRKIK